MIVASSDSQKELLEFIESSTGSFYEDLPCGLVFTRPDGTLVRANRTFLEWIGHTKDEVIGLKRFQDLLAGGSRIYYETNFAPLLRMQGKLREVALDLGTQSGTSVPVLVNSEEIPGLTGAVVLIRSTVFNISERRKYERELLLERRKAENSESRIRLLGNVSEVLRRSSNYRKHFQELCEVAVLEFCDASTVDLHIGKKPGRIAASHRILEKVPALCRSNPVLDQNRPLLIVDALDPAETASRPHLAETVEGLAPESLILVPIESKDEVVGTLGLYMTELRRRFDHEDLEVAQEIARRCAEAMEKSILHEENIRAEIALRESHEWFSTTLTSIGDAVIAVNLDKSISFLNGVAESLTGWRSWEAKGKPMCEVFNIVNQRTGQPAFNPVERVFADGKAAALENNTALIRRDGTRIIIEDSAAPIQGPQGKLFGVVLVFRDITQSHAESEAKARTLASLQEEREVREKFVATLTHDLRSPITAIKMSAQLILRKPDKPDIVQNQAVRVINSVSRADQMIQDLLDANRIRAGEKIRLEMSRCDLAAEIKEALIDLSTIHGDRFILEAPDALVGVWNCAGLRRVVENLCNNAVKYGTSRAPVSVSLRQHGDQAVLSVRNEGNPIPPDDQSTLFEPYRRTSSAQESGQKGWGLGLTLVRGVAEAHGGSVSVKSTPENGTTFQVTLPMNSASS